MRTNSCFYPGKKTFRTGDIMTSKRIDNSLLATFLNFKMISATLLLSNFVVGPSIAYAENALIKFKNSNRYQEYKYYQHGMVRLEDGECTNVANGRTLYTSPGIKITSEHDCLKLNNPDQTAYPNVDGTAIQYALGEQVISQYEARQEADYYQSLAEDATGLSMKQEKTRTKAIRAAERLFRKQLRVLRMADRLQTAKKNQQRLQARIDRILGSNGNHFNFKGQTYSGTLEKNRAVVEYLLTQITSAYSEYGSSCGSTENGDSLEIIVNQTTEIANGSICQATTYNPICENGSYDFDPATIQSNCATAGFVECHSGYLATNGACQQIPAAIELLRSAQQFPDVDKSRPMPVPIRIINNGLTSEEITVSLASTNFPGAIVIEEENKTFVIPAQSFVDYIIMINPLTTPDIPVIFLEAVVNFESRSGDNLLTLNGRVF